MKTELKKLIEQTRSDHLIALNDQQLDKLTALVEQLHKWNKAYNLTSVRDPKDMLSKHIVDSLVIAPYLTGRTFIDVGTGPGLPGLPLAIAEPDKSFVLLDSLGKRIRFIRQVCHQLNIDNVTAVQSRVEDYRQQDFSFDGVLSRAFASLNDMLSWCQHLPKADGKFYALKGQYPQQELDELSQQYKIDQIEKLQVPGVDGERHIAIISPAH
ncbi:16S rRNA (guanine(527)-N(7))-methyltransferase RsmG [Idiomarina seosinensis]|uniref:Ribosomal RNA small subunit methyltransferase G n=1 Tax=Idiomarina seosinensis TaxID=281739 RepID=A0A432ZE39_9GAMM|nr:16S rRNA (guanine(527)-N(7))-methyltransferase RsmG [Idiomarina seosinensis]RUO76235.1 16S rRNA (guanine(527)-N(7))-methyltransferase RsmG [Idiomarina seosinensis]